MAAPGTLPTLLLRALRHVLDVHRPVERRLAPDLDPRPERGALREPADAERERRRRLDRGRIDRRAAVRAERVRAPRAALGGLYVDLRLAREQAERLARRAHHRAERRAGERLAVRAVTEPGGVRVDDRLVGDAPAVAASVYFHVGSSGSAP